MKMANKVAPKISAPGSSKFPNTGGHTDGIQKGGHARGGPLAKVKPAGTGDPAGRLPVQHPTANQANKRIGQPNPDTSAAATAKPKRKGLGAAFYGEL